MAAVLFLRPSGLFPVKRAMTRGLTPGARGLRARSRSRLWSRISARKPISSPRRAHAHFRASPRWRSISSSARARLVSFGHSAVSRNRRLCGRDGSPSRESTTACLPRRLSPSPPLRCSPRSTGAVSLRASGIYYIMSTLAFGQMLYFLVVSLSAFGGDDGYTLPDRSTPVRRCRPRQPLASTAFALGRARAGLCAHRRVRRLAFRPGALCDPPESRCVRGARVSTPSATSSPLALIAGAIAAIAGVLLAEQSGLRFASLS